MNEDEVTTNEQTTDVEQTTAEPDDQQQLPADASPDDLTLEEIVQTNDDDFEAYQKGEITAAAIREKYSFNKEKETTENSSKTAETDNNQTPDDISKDADNNTTLAEDSTDTSTLKQYETLWKQVSAPFKANGKMYQPHSVNDIINLMQKGANYTQKMQQIAPYKKAFETLNKHQISEQELNFLIDLHNGNKKAIQALLTRNKFDPMDFTSEESNNYIPNNNVATDQDILVQDVLADIQENRDKISDVIMNKWDAKSKEYFLKNPTALRQLNEEFQLGRFDIIEQQVEQYKMFNDTHGISDLQLYSQFAKQYEQQQIAVMQQQAAQQAQQQQIAVNHVASKKAAAPTRGQSRAAKRRLSTEDIWNMSDEDFEKLKYTDIQAMEQN